MSGFFGAIGNNYILDTLNVGLLLTFRIKLLGHERYWDGVITVPYSIYLFVYQYEIYIQLIHVLM